MDLSPSYMIAKKFPWIPEATSHLKAPHMGMVFMGAPSLSTDSPSFLEFKRSGLAKAVIRSEPGSITRSLDRPIETVAQICTESNPPNYQIVDHPQTLIGTPDQSGNPSQVIPRSLDWQQDIAASNLPIGEIHTVAQQIRRLQERKIETKKAFEAEMVYASQLIVDYWVMMGRFGYVWGCPVLIPPYRSCDEVSAAAARNDETRNQLKCEWKVLLEEKERLLHRLLGK